MNKGTEREGRFKVSMDTSNMVDDRSRRKREVGKTRWNGAHV